MRKQTDRVNVAKRLLSKTDISHIPAMQWGISKEDTAKREYIRKCPHIVNLNTPLQDLL